MVREEPIVGITHPRLNGAFTGRGNRDQVLPRDGRVAGAEVIVAGERALPIGEGQSFDTDSMVKLLGRVIEEVAESGNSVIVGRGSPYILRNRPDVFHVFVFAPIDEKIRRVRTLGKSEAEARELVETIDKERAQFIKRYFGADWPCRQLYDLMINSDRGDEYVIETILNGIALAEKSASAVATAQ